MTNENKSTTTGERNLWAIAAIVLRNIANMLEQIGEKEEQRRVGNNQKIQARNCQQKKVQNASKSKEQRRTKK